MKITIKIVVLLVFIFIFSCEEQGLFVKCSDCTEDEPVNTSLEIKLDPDETGSGTQVNVYDGNVEDSILYDSFRTYSPNASVLVTLNKKYTVTATYFLHDNVYIAFDSATPKVRYEKSLCDNPCYFIYDKKIDLRLKYTK
jgi:hypothetical protein